MLKLLLIILISTNLFAAEKSEVKIDVKIENSETHICDIQFEMIAPFKKTFDFQTDKDGQFLELLDYGIYNITITKEYHSTITLSEVSLKNSETDLGEHSLHSIFGGVVTGVLEKGIYRVEKELIVPKGESLTIMPEVKLEFSQNIGATIEGDLIIQGGTSAKTVEFRSISEKSSEILLKVVKLNNQYKINNLHLVNIVLNFVRANEEQQVPNIELSNVYFEVNSQLKLFYLNATLMNLGFHSNISALSIDGGNYNIINSVFINNDSIAYLDHGYAGVKANFINCIFYGNSGSVYAWDNTNFINCLFNENSSLKPIIYTQAGVNIYNTIFMSNQIQGKKDIPLINLDNFGSINVHHSIFWNNSNDNINGVSEYFGDIFTSNENGDSVDVYNNIFKDPQINNSGNYVAINSENSICIDAGINLEDMVEYDLNGKTRILDGDKNSSFIVDIGPVEFGIDNTKGIYDIKKELLIYPNPAVDYVKLPKNKLNEINLYNSKGTKFIFKQKDYIINVSSLSRGIYLLNIDNKTYKIIKE